MKLTFTIILSLMLSISSFAQCDYLGGDLETYMDITSLVDEAGVLPPGTVIAPENHTSLLRFITIFFAGIFLDPTSPEYAELWSNGLGMSASEDAYTGDFALRIGGDATISVADLYSVTACNTIPGSFSFSYKHVGDGIDTLQLISGVGQGVLDAGGDLETDDLPGYVEFSLITSGTDDAYTTVNLPYIDNSLGIDVDTITTFFIILGDEASLQAGNESYFLIDDIKLDVMSSTVNTSETDLLVYPNPAVDRLNISGKNISTVSMLNANGAVVHTNNLKSTHHEIDIREFTSGLYFVAIRYENGDYAFEKVVVE